MEKKIDFYLRLKLNEVNEEIRKMIETPEIHKPENIVFFLQRTAKEIEKITTGLVLDVKSTIEFISSYQPLETYKVSNPILQELNEFYVFRKGLFVIGGLTHSGKTYLLLNVLIDLLKNNDVKILYIALDDSINHILRRLTAILLDKNIKTLTLEDIRKLEDFSFLKNLFFTNQFENIIDYIEYDIIAIDYFQNISSQKNIPVEDIRNYLNKKLFEIKQFVNIQQKTVFLISQLNRQAQGKKKENNFSENYYYRETSELENVADVAIDIQVKDKTQVPTVNKIILKKNKEYPTFFEKEIIFENGVLKDISQIGETFEDKEDIEIQKILKKQKEILKKEKKKTGGVK